MKWNFLIFTLGAAVVSYFAVSIADAMPAQIVIIRHGEKPAQVDGQDVSNELSPDGFKRADLLPQFFKNEPIVNQFGTAAAIFAMKPGSAEGSVRAIETVSPLATALNLPIQENITRDEVSTLVDTIKNDTDYDGKMVIICWEHQVIPQIAAAFGADTAPEKWGSVYDRAWVLDFTGDLVTTFYNIPEKLLPTDSQN